MVKAEQIGKVDGLGTIYEVSASLSKQITAFEEVGIKPPFLVTPEEVCMIRLAGLMNGTTRTCVAPVVVRDEGVILYKDSPLMNRAIAMVVEVAHAKNEYFTLDREFYEAVKDIAKKDLSLQPEDRVAHILEKNGDYILTSEMDDARFLLGKQTEAYFDRFVESDPIKIYDLGNFDLRSLPKNKCIINYLWFDWPGCGSDFFCWDRYLHYDYRALGVLKESAKGASQNPEAYTSAQIAEAIRGLGLEELILAKLSGK